MLERLRKKFVAVTTALTSVLLCILLLLVYHFTAVNLETEHISMMQSVSDGMGPGGFRPEASTSNDRLHYFILSRTIGGNLVVAGNTSFDLSDEALLVDLYVTASQAGDRSGVLEQYSLRWLKLDNRPGDSIVFSDISDEQSALRSLRNTCILVGLLSLLVLYGLINYLSKYIIKPTEEAWNQQKQFVADASHELKTPLTVIMTNAELLSSSEYSETQKKEFSANILSMSKRMRGLIEGMLDLARLDNGVAKDHFASVDYSELNESCVMPFEPLFFEAGRFLDSRIAPNLTVMGSAGHLTQVTDILLDNALKYSHEGSTVVLTLERQNRHALLCVDSVGSPIPQADLERIFHRFYTVDKSRTGDSYGLGLSIAYGIIQEHQGKIWAETMDNHNKFFVKLPL